MTKSPPASAALSGTAFATLMLIALMMGANHVAARLAFNNGVDVATAVTFRGGVTAVVVTLLCLWQGVPWRLTARHRRAVPLIGVLIGVQSLCLYSAVARLPVALALLAFNTYPLWTALWARLVYGHRPEPRVLPAMPVMLLGLARKASNEFSSFLATPTLIGAGAYSLYKERALLTAADIPMFSVGLVFSFISAWLCVRWLLRYISTHSFVPFAYYRIVFGVVVLVSAWSGLVQWAG